MHIFAKMLSAVLVAAFFVFQTTFSHAEGLFSATVTQCTDGDTLVLDTGQRVRLAGVDTPEKVPRTLRPNIMPARRRTLPANGQGSSGLRLSRFPGRPATGIKGSSLKSSFPTGVPSMNSSFSTVWPLFTRIRTFPANWCAA